MEKQCSCLSEQSPKFYASRMQARGCSGVCGGRGGQLSYPRRVAGDARDVAVAGRVSSGADQSSGDEMMTDFTARQFYMNHLCP